MKHADLNSVSKLRDQRSEQGCSGCIWGFAGTTQDITEKGYFEIGVPLECCSDSGDKLMLGFPNVERAEIDS